MKLLLALLLASCTSPIQQESSAIIHESVTPVPAPLSPCVTDCPPAPVMAPLVAVPTPTPVPTMLEVKKKRKGK